MMDIIDGEGEVLEIPVTSIITLTTAAAAATSIKPLILYYISLILFN